MRMQATDSDDSGLGELPFVNPVDRTTAIGLWLTYLFRPSTLIADVGYNQIPIVAFFTRSPGFI
jgi:hypothetical protein